MTSHEYAEQLAEIVKGLYLKPEFEMPAKPYIPVFYYGNKEWFLQAVKSLGAGAKVYKGTELQFRPAVCPALNLIINRDDVCRKVQDEKWECEALLSPEEDDLVGQAI